MNSSYIKNKKYRKVWDKIDKGGFLLWGKIKEKKNTQPFLPPLYYTITFGGNLASIFYD